MNNWRREMSFNRSAFSLPKLALCVSWWRVSRKFSREWKKKRKILLRSFIFLPQRLRSINSRRSAYEHTRKKGSSWRLWSFEFSTSLCASFCCVGVNFLSCSFSFYYITHFPHPTRSFSRLCVRWTLELSSDENLCFSVCP